jgi:hypothetical protein
MRATALFFIALVTVFIVFWVKRPDIISDFWLWLVGLAGPIIALFKRLKQEAENSNFFKKIIKK